MRTVWQRIIGLVTIYTIVVQAFAFALTPASASPHGFDPFSIICSSETGTASADQAPATSPVSHGCDHCVLCAATTPPEAPSDSSKVSFKATALPFAWPAETLPANVERVAGPELPTGPPSLV